VNRHKVVKNRERFAAKRRCYNSRPEGVRQSIVMPGARINVAHMLSRYAEVSVHDFVIIAAVG
jgi:hypothetical protein